MNRKNPAPFSGDAVEADQKLGAFVTLKINDHLRGCIGHIAQDTPLKDVLRDMTIHAAFYDPRFEPVSRREFEKITIEISVLTPFELVQDEAEIEIGRDGLMLTLGYRSGLLLPQVPVEWGWDRDEFLHHLCQKAGLKSGSHKHPDAILQKFSAIVFSEKDFTDR